jgi:hypothetical protein
MLKQSWHSSLAVVTALGLSAGTVLPLMVLEQPATAGLFAQQNRAGRVEAGTTVIVAEPDGKKIVLDPEETVAVTLATQEPIRSDRGTVLIPKGTKVEGEFQPIEDGTQFVARRLLFQDGTERELDATTNMVNYRKTISKGTKADPIWQGALVGGAASAAISSLVTKPGVFKTLAGAGAGALAGWLIAGRSQKTEVIVIRPEESLTLTLESDLVLRDRN